MGNERHVVADVACIDCSGCLFDVSGNGLMDWINGNCQVGSGLRWGENPGEHRREPHLIARTRDRDFHDIALRDDGRPSLVFNNQWGKSG